MAQRDWFLAAFGGVSDVLVPCFMVHSNTIGIGVLVGHVLFVTCMDRARLTNLMWKMVTCIDSKMGVGREGPVEDCGTQNRHSLSREAFLPHVL